MAILSDIITPTNVLTATNTQTLTNKTFGDNPVLNAGTAGGVAYLNGAKTLTTGSALTFDGTNFATTGSVTGATLKTTRASGAQPEVVLTQTGVASWSIYNPPSSTDLRFYNGSDLLTLTSSGNLGLGVTPSAWAAGWKTMQIGARSFVAQGGISDFVAGYNWYQAVGGTNTYIATSGANAYLMDGAHKWLTAPSGTAGNAITFTQAMTLDASSNLVVTGNVTAYSDERLKTDWAPVAENFVDRLATIKSGTYTRTDSGDRQAGSSAQDWQKLLPEVVMEGTDESKTLALAYGNAALVAAVELAKELVALKAEVAALKQGK
jgi:hypothetical protein